MKSCDESSENKELSRSDGVTVVFLYYMHLHYIFIFPGAEMEDDCINCLGFNCNASCNIPISPFGEVVIHSPVHMDNGYILYCVNIIIIRLNSNSVL